MPDADLADGFAAGCSATLGGTVRSLSLLFQRAGIACAQLDARILGTEACGVPAEYAIFKPETPLSPEQIQRASDFAERRLAGEPVSRIIGRREFWGLSFRVTPDTLDPRPETELLVETALSFVKAKGKVHAPLGILDAGSGTGCILGALLTELPKARGLALDRSWAALTIARNNLKRLGLLNRVSFLCGDWLSAIGGAPFDVIVCNPPYIAHEEIQELEAGVRVYDPGLALDGGEDGLQAYRIIVPQALACVRPGGLVVFETGYRQGRAVQDLMKQSGPHPGFASVRLLTDLSGADRAVAGVRQS